METTYQSNTEKQQIIEILSFLQYRFKLLFYVYHYYRDSYVLW